MIRIWRPFLPVFGKAWQFIYVSEKWVNFVGMEKNDNIVHCSGAEAKFRSKQPQCNSTQ